MKNFNLNCFFTLALCVLTSTAWADSLELKNGSLINSKFVSGTESEISFQVGSSVQKFRVGDLVSIKFGEHAAADTSARQFIPRPAKSVTSAQNAANVTVPAGTRILIRTVDAINARPKHVGNRFQASRQEPLTVNGVVVAPMGADGRLAESKKSGTFTGRSELQLELTGIVVNRQTVPLVTGQYALSGNSRTASTAKRTIAGAAVGSVIGAIAGGGKGAGIGAAGSGGAGAGSEINTKGDQVKVPSETLLYFTPQQEVTLPTSRG